MFSKFEEGILQASKSNFQVYMLKITFCKYAPGDIQKNVHFSMVYNRKNTGILDFCSQIFTSSSLTSVENPLTLGLAM